MIKFENTEVMGWESAIRGMRNPMNSWEKSDSKVSICECEKWPHNINKSFASIGPNDHDLMMCLRNAGPDHRKFMRMITVYVDITAPLYWWKEFDTYKIGTVANSCSTMHKIADKKFTLDDFSCEHLTNIFALNNATDPVNAMEHTITCLNFYRELYLETKDKKYWWQIIQLLPSSYNQKRTVMLNYEVLANIYKARKNHKLDEWAEHDYWTKEDLQYENTLRKGGFCDWIKTLPYSELITGLEE